MLGVVDIVEHLKMMRCSIEKQLHHAELIEIVTPIGTISIRWCAECKDWVPGGNDACPECSTSWYNTLK